jgi:hypothetical protein
MFGASLKLVLLSPALACGWCAAQDAAAGTASNTPGLVVRLEAHNGQTQFKIGDPITVDLVFTSAAAGYSVDIDANLYQPSADIVYVSPDGGWVRSSQSLSGKSLNGNALVALGSEPVRVPVLINRTILFERPGHYEVSVSSERLRSTSTLARLSPINDCNPCTATNAVGIDIAARDATEETELVASLCAELEATKGQMPKPELTDSQKKTMQDVEERLRSGDLSDEGQKRIENLSQKLNEIAAEQMAAIEKKQADLLLAAQRLACLEGDEAVRAKVHIIAAAKEADDEESRIALILVNGLSSSRNKQLQLDLLEAAWRDPKNLPTYELQVGLRAARELVRDGMVKIPGFGETEAERKAALKQDQADLDVIIGTLPERSEPNRAQTIQILKQTGTPNPFNQRDSHP